MREGNNRSFAHIFQEFKSKQGMFDRFVPYCCNPNKWPEEDNFMIVQITGINKHVFQSSLLLISFVGLTGL